MRTILGAAFSLAAAGIAAAADFPANNYYTAPAPLSAGSWVGPYLGANVGYELATVDNNPTKPSGIAGGIEAGYNWQRGQFVFGAKPISSSQARMPRWRLGNFPIRGSAPCAAAPGSPSTTSLSTAPPASPTVICASTPQARRSRTPALAWTAGAGVEVGFTPRWSAKAEWLYLDLMDRGFSVTGTNNGLAANLIRFGVNNHF